MRALAQLALLPVLVALATYDSDIFVVVLAIASTITWLLSCAVALLLVWIARAAERDAAADGSHVPDTLLEAADNATTMALVATGVAAAAAMGAARVLGLIPPAGTILLAVLGWALVLVGVPAISWLTTLRRVWLPMLGRRWR